MKEALSLTLYFVGILLLISILWGPTPDKLADLAAENREAFRAERNDELALRAREE